MVCLCVSVRLLKIWEARAVKYHTHRVCRQVLLVMVAGSRRTKLLHRKASNRAKAHAMWQRLALSKHLAAWRFATDELMMEKFKTEVALQHFYDKMKPVLFQRWVERAAARRQRRRVVLALFLNCLDSRVDNSSRQRAQQALADSYRAANLMAPAFWALRHVTLELSPLRHRKERADQHFKQAFFRSVCRRAYRALADYLEMRRDKRVKAALAQAHFLTTSLYNALTRLRMMGRIRRFAKQRRARRQERALITMRLNVDERQAKKAWMAEAAGVIGVFLRTLAGDRALRRFEANRLERIDRRAKTLRARAKYRRTLSRKVFGVWKHYREQVKAFMARLEDRGDARLLARIFYRLLDNVTEQREEREEREAAEREARRIAEEARIKFEREAAAATRIQTRYRVVHCKQKAAEWRVFRDWAVIKVGAIIIET